ncbi:hypothetical protein IscW_ISCW011574 [Ixodes scapularis]|uniref:Uncharacterized protein n=1 Tax=Ixodes scapularis TaxID=6945 RepID=B7Q7N4_IXOSC|nr:hypothetical protein IscW_ISCW011574 [Ixodes scapularis]|eukprot:XP_002412189.1 hypothetical protein IscW_ISCW011574 [Ixodes scapularis]
MIMEDFVGDNDFTGTTAELTNVEITAEVLREQLVASNEPSAADAEGPVPVPSSSEAVTVVAPLSRHCSATEGSGLCAHRLF